MEDKIIDRISRRLTLDAQRNKDYRAYDDIDEMQWEIPWKAEEWVRKKVSSTGHDGLKSVVNMFNTYAPKFEILPRGPADTDTAEGLERWLEWQMWQANQLGEKEPFRTALKHSAKYTLIAMQLDYLPYWLTNNNEERKRILETGAFCINVHEPCTVHYEMGKYGLRWVTSVANVPAADILDHWELYADENSDMGKKIKGAVRKVLDLLEEDEEQRLVYVDYTDKEKRYVFAYATTSDRLDDELEIPEDTDKFIEIVNAENELPFINWVIGVSTGDPLFYSIHKSGAWENQNFLESIADSTIIRRAFFPILKHMSPTNKPLEVDYTGAEAVIELGAGETAEQVSPPPLDPGVRELMDRNNASMGSGIGVKGLQNSDITGNVQFAAVNAQIQMGKTVLDPHVRNFEKTMAHLGRMMFKWVQYMDDTVTSYRNKTTKSGTRGSKINVSPKDFDPDRLQIICELMANTPTDDMQRWNMFSGMLQTGLKIPQSEIVERLEMGDPNVLKQEFFKEKVEDMAFQLFQQQKQMELQMQQQQAQQAMQQQQAQQAQAAQAQQGGGGMVPPDQGGGSPSFDQTQGQGYDPNQGGSSPMEAAPSQTQSYTKR